MSSIENRVKSAIRDIQDFPKEGILFKDITPVLKDPKLRIEIASAFCDKLEGTEIDAVAGIESRGFLFGPPLADRLDVPFIPIRKKGKLPYETVSHQYELEYGTAEIEMHKDALQVGQRILIHDDLLATGGTAEATAALVKSVGGEIAGFCFLVALDFLNGKKKLEKYGDNIVILANY